MWRWECRVLYEPFLFLYDGKRLFSFWFAMSMVWEGGFPALYCTYIAFFPQLITVLLCVPHVSESAVQWASTFNALLVSRYSMFLISSLFPR